MKLQDSKYFFYCDIFDVKIFVCMQAKRPWDEGSYAGGGSPPGRRPIVAKFLYLNFCNLYNVIVNKYLTSRCVYSVTYVPFNDILPCCQIEARQFGLSVLTFQNFCYKLLIFPSIQLLGCRVDFCHFQIIKHFWNCFYSQAEVIFNWITQPGIKPTGNSDRWS